MIPADPQAVRRLEDFFAHYTAIEYKRGEVILRAEDIPFGVYYLYRGYVRQYLLAPSGETFIVHIYKPGSFFPLTWVLNDTPNIYHFESMTPARVVRAPKEAFVSLLKEHPDALLYATQRLASGLSGFVSRVAQLVLDDAYTKTILLLLYYAENFGETMEEGIALRIPLTHREIASWIGTTRETASIQMEKLLHDGLVVTKGRLLIIRNPDALRRLVRGR